LIRVVVVFDNEFAFGIIKRKEEGIFIGGRNKL